MKLLVCGGMGFIGSAFIRNHLSKNPMPGTERVLEQTLERVRIRSKFLQRVKTEFT